MITIIVGVALLSVGRTMTEPAVQTTSAAERHALVSSGVVLVLSGVALIAIALM
ncbi:hypothetical protein [Klenkia soli]|uniref:hypothetical protein n=1 Tax=Klenkia soli TaxID=1052260 RepID=UPI0013F4F501|nr:hypothetical protein [Klenkia soli]